MTKFSRDNIYNVLKAPSVSFKVKYDSKISLDRKSLCGERNTHAHAHMHTQAYTRTYTPTSTHSRAHPHT